jgi:hypothetical protein
MIKSSLRMGHCLALRNPILRRQSLLCLHKVLADKRIRDEREQRDNDHAKQLKLTRLNEIVEQRALFARCKGANSIASGYNGVDDSIGC